MSSDLLKFIKIDEYLKEVARELLSFIKKVKRRIAFVYICAS